MVQIKSQESYCEKVKLHRLVCYKLNPMDHIEKMSNPRTAGYIKPIYIVIGFIFYFFRFFPITKVLCYTKRYMGVYPKGQILTRREMLQKRKRKENNSLESITGGYFIKNNILRDSINRKKGYILFNKITVSNGKVKIFSLFMYYFFF